MHGCITGKTFSPLDRNKGELGRGSTTKYVKLKNFSSGFRAISLSVYSKVNDCPIAIEILKVPEYKKKSARMTFVYLF